MLLCYRKYHKKVLAVCLQFGERDVPYLSYMLYCHENQKAVTAYLKSKQLLPSGFERQYSDKRARSTHMLIILYYIMKHI